MAKDDERRGDENALNPFALELDDSILSEALEAVERRFNNPSDALTGEPSAPSHDVLGIDFESPTDEIDTQPSLELDVELEFNSEADGLVSEMSSSEASALQSEIEALRAESETLRAELAAATEAAEREAAARAQLQTEFDATQATMAENQQRLDETLRKATLIIQKSRRKENMAEQVRAERDDLRERVLQWEPLIREYRERLRAADEERTRQRTRHARELEETRHFGAEKLIKTMLPVLDHMEMALEHKAHHDRLIEGVEMIRSQFQSALYRQGLQRIQVDAADPFDPERHEAISYVPSEEFPADTVAVALHPAYGLNGRLLRAARVVVSSGPPTPEPGETAQFEAPSAEGAPGDLPEVSGTPVAEE